MIRPCHPLFLVAALLLGWQAQGMERPTVDGWPGHAVGKVNVRGGGFCTATLIAPDQVLTTARCLRDPAGRWLSPNRVMVEFAPHRDARQGHAAVERIVPAPGLRLMDGTPNEPVRDWVILELAPGRRGREVQPVTLASLSERGGLGEGSLLSLVAYTPQRPYIATIAEGCRFRELRGEPQVLLHDCAASAAVAGAALFLETPRGPVLLGIQLGTGLLDGKPVGAAAMLERTLDLETLAGRPTGP